MSAFDEAKKMYFAYGCSLTSMGRDGAIHKYEAFGVGREYEDEWRLEYIEIALPEYLAAVQAKPEQLIPRGSTELQICNAVEALPKLVEVKAFSDDRAKFWHAYLLYRLSLSADAENPEPIILKARFMAYTMLTELAAGRPSLSDASKRLISKGAQENLRAESPEEYIVNYANELLAEIGRQDGDKTGACDL